MAGHNKWSKIKHKKGAADAKRSKVWTKLIRELTVASRMGGNDPTGNPRLRKAIDEARAANMPKDTIQRAVDRGSDAQDGANFEELVYEGYGPGGVALLIECTTDNRNRTSGEVRTVLNKKGGNLGTSGSVGFLFNKRGQITFEKGQNGISEDKLMEVGLENGLEDVEDDGENLIASCAPENFHTLLDAFQAAGLKPSSSELAMVPDNLVEVEGKNAETLLSLIEALEDLDDVQHVFSNLDISDAEMDRILSSAR